MSKQKKFRPGVSGLEDRVALSHASATIGDLSNLRVMVRGVDTTTLPAGIGGGSTASLVGGTRIRRVGPVGFQGTLSDNGSLPPPFSNTHGQFVLSARNGMGSVTLSINGPATDLAPRRPTRSHFTFEVSSATGQLSSVVGKTGTADMVLVTRSRPGSGTARGNFVVILSANLA